MTFCGSNVRCKWTGLAFLARLRSSQKGRNRVNTHIGGDTLAIDNYTPHEVLRGLGRRQLGDGTAENVQADRIFDEVAVLALWTFALLTKNFPNTVGGVRFDFFDRNCDDFAACS